MPSLARRRYRVILLVVVVVLPVAAVLLLWLDASFELVLIGGVPAGSWFAVVCVLEILALPLLLVEAAAKLSERGRIVLGALVRVVAGVAFAALLVAILSPWWLFVLFLNDYRTLSTEDGHDHIVAGVQTWHHTSVTLYEGNGFVYERLNVLVPEPADRDFADAALTREGDNLVVRYATLGGVPISVRWPAEHEVH